MTIYLLNGAEPEPHEEEELRSMLSAGLISANALAWREGLEGWLPLALVMNPEVHRGLPPIPCEGDVHANTGRELSTAGVGTVALFCRTIGVALLDIVLLFALPVIAFYSGEWIVAFGSIWFLLCCASCWIHYKRKWRRARMERAAGIPDRRGYNWMELLLDLTITAIGVAGRAAGDSPLAKLAALPLLMTTLWLKYKRRQFNKQRYAKAVPVPAPLFDQSL